MLEKITRNWWMYAIRGLIAIIFGVVAFARPEETLTALVLAFGAFALVDGFFAIFAGISMAPMFKRWWAVSLEGLIGVIAGVVILTWPDITAQVLLYMIAAWAIITGIFEIVAAIQIREEIDGEWALALSGVLSIVFGALLIAFPGAGAVSMIWVIATFAIVFGILEIILAFRMRSLHNETKTTN